MNIFAKETPNPIDFGVHACHATVDALANVDSWNKGNILCQGVARVLAMTEVPLSLGVDAVSNILIAGWKATYAVTTKTVEVAGAVVGLKGRVNPLNLKHATLKEAAIHMRQAVINLLLTIPTVLLGITPCVMAPIGPGMFIPVPIIVVPAAILGLLAPTALQKRVLEACGNAKPVTEQGRTAKLATKCLNGLKACGKRLKPSRRTLKIAGGVAVGAAAVTAGVCAANAYGYLAKDSLLAGVTVGNLKPWNWSIFSKDIRKDSPPRDHGLEHLVLPTKGPMCYPANVANVQMCYPAD